MKSARIGLDGAPAAFAGMGPPMTVYKTVGELIEALKELPADAQPISLHPPFDGVRLVPQDSGHILICPPERVPLFKSAA